MPCTQCGHTRIYLKGNLVCPACQKYKVLDPITAHKISRKRIEYANQLWDKARSGFATLDILEKTVFVREQNANLIVNIPADLGIMARQTMLLKRIITNGSLRKPGADSNQYDNASVMNDVICSLENDPHMIKSGLSLMIYFGTSNVEEIYGQRLLQDIGVYQTEWFISLAKYYEKTHNLTTADRAHQKFLEMKDEFDRIRHNPPKPHQFTTHEVISKHYDLICTLHIGLARNQALYNTFNLESYKKLTQNPSDVLKLTQKFERHANQITHCTKTEFLSYAKQVFKRHKIPELEKVLLFSSTNPDAFSLFVGYQKNGDDYVMISHEFTKVVYLLLHAVVSKDLFDMETQRRGKELEGKIKDAFEKAGFTYHSNVKDRQKNPHLEVDGISRKGDKCFVVESKTRGVQKMIEELDVVSGQVMFLKGIVDGYKTTHEQPRRIPGLLEKIEFAKRYLSSNLLDEGLDLKFTGIIVTTIHPWISEYKGVKIISYWELLSKLSSGSITQ